MVETGQGVSLVARIARKAFRHRKVISIPAPAETFENDQSRLVKANNPKPGLHALSNFARHESEVIGGISGLEIR